MEAAPSRPGEATKRLDDRIGRRWAARDEDIDLDDVRYAAFHAVGPGEDAAVTGAVTDCDYDGRARQRVVGLAERACHVPRHGPGDEDPVRVPRRRHEADPVLLGVIVRREDRADLEFAAVAGPGVDLAQLDRAVE